MAKFASIDFEYYDTAEKRLNVICASIRSNNETKNYWVHNDYLKDGVPTGIPSGMYIMNDMLLKDINLLNEKGYVFLAYNVVAEASSFISLGLNPLNFKWIDLYLEYRCLSNHNDRYAYGKQVIKGKKKFTTKPIPKWMRKTEADEKKADASKQEYGMGSAVYKTLGIVIDSKMKTDMRDIIIACNSGKQEDIDTMVSHKKLIMEYCDSDVIHLEPMLEEMIREYKKLYGDDFNISTLVKEMYIRSEHAVRSAMTERVGYPINVEHTRNFSSQVGNIIWTCQHDINSQFTDVKYFRATVKKRPFDLSMDQAEVRRGIRKWCRLNGYDIKKWTLTDGGKSGKKDLSLSLKAFQKPISFSHTYPRGNFIAQMQRFLKLKQGLNGFIPPKAGAKKKTFWDSVGKDGRVRPYMGIYGAQSARNQPSATGFIPLKSAWMRSLIAPRAGRAICGIDYASQEFLLAALLSGDRAMLEAYESGDVYLAFGKAIGYIPANGTKKTHKKERDDCKAVVLGLSYDMSEFGLAIDLSDKFGRKVTPEEAKRWINKHKRAYPVFWRWKDALQRHYKQKKYLKLADGWTMFGDNDNFRSIGNVPVQGMGSCIMRKAVQFAQKDGLDVIYSLHDAIYIEFDIDRIHDAPAILAQCMDKAFRFYFKDDIKPRATVRLDSDVWGPDCTNNKKYNLSYSTPYDTYLLETKEQTIYVDPRGEEEYDKYKKYFIKEDFSEFKF
jgi:hypothetical protein